MAGVTMQSPGCVGYDWVGFGRHNGVTASILEFRSYSSLGRIAVAVAVWPLAYNEYEKPCFARYSRITRCKHSVAQPIFVSKESSCRRCSLPSETVRIFFGQIQRVTSCKQSRLQAETETNSCWRLTPCRKTDFWVCLVYMFIISKIQWNNQKLGIKLC